MSKSSNQKVTSQPQFSLKHRLIGAGILISFGVLILPWLLGSYSFDDQVAQVKTEETVKPSSIAKLATKAASKTVNNEEIVESTKDPLDKKDVKVFVSRVQPLEKNGAETPKKTPVTPVKKSDKKQTKTVKKEPVKSKPVTKTVKKVEPKKDLKQSTPKEVKQKPKNNDIERGYIVSVGVFGDEKNVQKMVSDLKSKKFNPSVRKEKFNNKSVSRIFMGPFKTRAEAGKVKLRLSEKQNIPSLIKEFP